MLPSLPTLVRPVTGAIVSAVVIMLVLTVVDTSLFVQLVLAGAAGMLAYVLVVVPRDQVRQMRMRLSRVR